MPHRWHEKVAYTDQRNNYNFYYNFTLYPRLLKHFPHPPPRYSSQKKLYELIQNHTFSNESVHTKHSLEENKSWWPQTFLKQWNLGLLRRTSISWGWSECSGTMNTFISLPKEYLIDNRKPPSVRWFKNSENKWFWMVLKETQTLHLSAVWSSDTITLRTEENSFACTSKQNIRFATSIIPEFYFTEQRN